MSPQRLTAWVFFCFSCRIPGTRRSQLVCESCRPGWRLRKSVDGRPTACGERTKQTLSSMDTATGSDTSALRMHTFYWLHVLLWQTHCPTLAQQGFHSTSRTCHVQSLARPRQKQHVPGNNPRSPAKQAGAKVNALCAVLADCQPGFWNGVSGFCQPCPKGKWCPGGHASINPNSTALDCPVGLATVLFGAISQAQVKAA